MKKPVKKTVKPKRKRTAPPARSVSQARKKAPARPVHPAARKSKTPTSKARPQALVIPPILLETAPPPEIPQIAESKPVESQIMAQRKVAEVPLAPSVIPLPSPAAVVVHEPAPLIPSLAEVPVAPFPLEPVAPPMPVVPEEAPVAIPQPEPPVMSAEAPVMEYHEPERGVLRLLARDPHWLFATWEFSDASLEHCRLHSSDGRLHLKVHALDHGRGKEQEIVLTAEACEWFIPVQEAGTTCQVEMGYRNWADAWVTVANPATASTPAEAPAAPAAAQMRTVVFPPEKAASRPILNAGAEMKSVPCAENRPAPRITIAPEVPWIPEVQAALENLSAPVLKAQIPVAAQSLHLAAPERAFQGPEAAPSPAGLPTSIPGVFSLPTSPQPGPLPPLNLPGAAPARKFSFTVNAELIVYGATEPDARVEIGGHPIRLRPDGGFSFRFALPDGQYELPVAALSADGVEFRGAVLQFERSTQTAGTVGVHPQDPELKKPAPEFCV